MPRKARRSGAPAYLIVNADDYGYFPSVSRGIIQAAREGAVTATGILSTSPTLDPSLRELRSVEGLDFGVHLTLTHGVPLTGPMRRAVSRWNQRFPGVVAMTGAILRGRIPLATVREEWRAQIERCREHGLRIRFLNSHEHVHMLPRLHRLARDLARDEGIPFVRRVRGERSGWSGLPRNLVLGALSLTGPRHAEPCMLGAGHSGRLTLERLRRLVAALAPGRIYELMCHPGLEDCEDVEDERLRAYHDWGRELHALTHRELPRLLADHEVELIGYRHLRRSGGRLLVQEPPVEV